MKGRFTERRSRVASALSRASLRHVWNEHGLALCCYVVLAVGLSWPLIPHFTTMITGGRHADSFHNLWLLWHVQQAMAGEHHLFYFDVLYYPYGATLLTHGLGPVMGFLALPFWPWGPAAAVNGAVFVSLCLNGYCMYLLARGLDLSRPAALFAGLMFLTSPMVLAGIGGHMTKVFLAAIPLVLLSLHYALDPRRSAWWAVVTALALLVALLHSGYQFVFAAGGIAFFTLSTLVIRWSHYRWFIIRRSVFLGGSIAVLLGPLLAATIIASRHPALLGGSNAEEAIRRSPDVLNVLLPTHHHILIGRFISRTPLFSDVPMNIETTISLSWVGIGLSLVALWRGSALVRQWLLFVVICVLCSLGPVLHLWGNAYPAIPMPYTFVTSLPGVGFMRVPGRFMMIGFVGLSFVAAAGLALLIQRYSLRTQYVLVLLCAVLVLFERWPRPWPQYTLPPMPEFYAQIADDTDDYGVFHLPVVPLAKNDWVMHNGYSQVYQIAHEKGVPDGYLSRSYGLNPLFPHLMSRAVHPTDTGFFVNGTPVNVYANAQDILATSNYRYVVWHKTQEDRSSRRTQAAGPPAQESARNFVAAVFGDQAPLVDDDLVQVYEVRPAAGAPPPTTTMTLDTNWYPPLDSAQRGISPATFTIYSSHEQRAMLHIQVADVENDLPLVIQSPALLTESVELIPGSTTTLPLHLQAGEQDVTLRIRAESLRPEGMMGEIRTLLGWLATPDQTVRPASFADDLYRKVFFSLESVNLETFGNGANGM